MALAVSAMLLAATAAAVDASIRAHEITGRRTDLNQAARVTLHRVVSGIRTGREHAPLDGPGESTFLAGGTATSGHFGLFDEAGSLIAFRHDPATRRLMMGRDAQEFVLLEGVTNFAVTAEPMQSSGSRRIGGDFDLLRRASILLTVERDGQSLTLSGSVVPRKNFW